MRGALTGDASGPYVLAVDVGGTFTDVTAVELSTGAWSTTKVATTPDDATKGLLEAVVTIMDRVGGDCPEVGHFAHATTVATNAIVENRGPRTGLITTQGFRYVLEIGRHDIPRAANVYSWRKPARPIEPAAIFEVAGRLGPGGEEIEPLDDDEVLAAADRLREDGVRACAVCLLHSYANPGHERRVEQLLRERVPGIAVAISSRVMPVFREYERTMVTALNAFVQPVVADYLHDLRGTLRGRALPAAPWVMKSSGGLVSAEIAADQAITTALSGPAAGVIGAVAIARDAGERDVITMDMGGTSTDVSLIKDGELPMTTGGSVGPWPYPLPTVDVHTIGAGGGSIVTVTEQGAITVGPASAGAFPGPACYGHGGRRPTVTDANLVLGRIPRQLVGGEMGLDVEAARVAIRREVAEPLGLPLEAAAEGIIRMATSSMAAAIRLVSVERGHDPRGFPLVAFGGAGPLHAAAVAERLQIPRVLIPPAAGVLSTWGLLGADLKNDYARTAVQYGPLYDVAAVNAIFAELQREADAWLADEGVPAERRHCTRLIDVRYRHQGHELTIPFASGDLDALVVSFHADHTRLYGYAQDDVPVDLVTFRVRAVGRLPRSAPSVDGRSGGWEPAPTSGHRSVHFSLHEGFVDCPRFDRAALAAGAAVRGPAVIDQLDTTTLAPRGYTAHVDEHANLILRRD